MVYALLLGTSNGLTFQFFLPGCMSSRPSTGHTATSPKVKTFKSNRKLSIVWTLLVNPFHTTSSILNCLAIHLHSFGSEEGENYLIAITCFNRRWPSKILSAESKKGINTHQSTVLPLSTRRAYCYRLCTVIVPFWSSTEHLETALMPFWFSTDDMRILWIFIFLVRTMSTSSKMKILRPT